MTKTKRTMSDEHRQKIAASVKKNWEGRKREGEASELILAERKQNNQLISMARSRDVFRNQFLNLTAATVRSILDSTETGQLLDWYEFVEVMTEEDPHLRGLVTKRKGAISAKELKIIPADQEDDGAVLAAEIVRKAIEDISDLDRSLRHLLDGIFSGMGALEILWTRKDLGDLATIWSPELLEQIPGKRFRIGEHEGRWRYYLHDYGQFDNNDNNPVYVHRDKFIIHSPGEEDYPHFRGLLRALAFTYFFKKLGMTYWLGGAEKHSFPSIYALVPNSTPDNIRAALVSHLDALTSDGAAVLNSDVDIRTLGSSATGGDVVWKGLLAYLDTLMTKLILGGTLAVEAASGPGGNRALGEVHERSAQAIVDGDARALAETVRFQLVKPILEKNLHLFGGIMPPLPKVSFDVTTRDPVPIGQIHIQAQAVTINEMRKEAGLPPVEWGEERALFGAAVAQPDGGNGEAGAENQVEAGAAPKPVPNQEEIEELYASQDLSLVVRQKGSQYCVYSKSGDEIACHSTKEEAVNQLRAIEAQKNG